MAQEHDVCHPKRLPIILDLLRRGGGPSVSACDAPPPLDCPAGPVRRKGGPGFGRSNWGALEGVRCTSSFLTSLRDGGGDVAVACPHPPP